MRYTHTHTHSHKAYTTSTGNIALQRERVRIASSSVNSRKMMQGTPFSDKAMKYALVHARTGSTHSGTKPFTY